MVESASKGGTTVKAAPTKKATSGCVLLSFNCSGHQSIVGAMRHCGHLSSVSQLHESAVFAAIVSCIQAKMTMSPADVVRTGVMCVKGHIINGRGCIAMCTAANVSGVKKALNNLGSALQEGKLYAAYSRYTRNVGEPPNREYFSHACDSAMKSMKDSDILVTGRLKITKPKLQEIADSANKALNKLPSISGKKSSPKVEKAEASEKSHKSATVKVPDGILCYILKSQIKKRLPGACVSWEGNNIKVGCTEAQLEAATNKDRSADHAAKLAKIVDKNGIECIIHVAACRACGDAAKLASDAGKSWTKSSLTV
jgi:hypothetical protein